MPLSKRLMVADDNVIDDCELSGGLFEAQLPLSFAQTRQIDQKARTIGADPRNTWFYAAAPTAVTVAAFALVGNNFSEAADVRYRGFSTDPRGVVSGVFTGNAIPTGWTFSRTSATATYFGSDGLLHVAAADEPRFEWVGGVRMGLLIESLCTNLVLWSRDLTNAGWSKTSATASKTVTGIDGTSNSCTRLTASSANGQAVQAVAAAGGAVCVFSAYIRRVTGTGQVLLTEDNFTTSTNVAGSLNTSTFTRVQITTTADGLGRVGIRLATAGDVIDVDCVQLEAVSSLNASATSPLITTSSTTSRGADILSATVAGMSFAGGSMMMVGGLISRPGAAAATLARIGNGGTSEVGFTISNAGVPSASYINASAQQVSGVSGAAISAGSEFAAAMSWAANDVRASFDGAATAQDTSITVPAVTMTAATVSTSGNAAFYLRRIEFYPTTRTNAQLQGLSGTDRELPADFDSGLVDAWPPEYLAGTPARRRVGAKTPALHVPAAAQSFPYWRTDIIDAANADGFVEFGRPMFMWFAFQADKDTALGQGIDFVPRATAVRADSGSRYFEERPEPRVYDFTFHALADAEAWQSVYELMRQRGSSGEVLFSMDPTDLANLPRQTFACTLESLSKLIAASKGFWTKAYRAEELL